MVSFPCNATAEDFSSHFYLEPRVLSLFIQVVILRVKPELCGTFSLAYKYIYAYL